MSNPSRSIRTASYSNEEDKLLCTIYLDIAQDKDKGKDRSGEQLWEVIADEYQRMLPAHINTHRPWRSLQNRFSTIMTAVGKLRGCVRQIENMNPSGVSDQDIMDRAKELLMQDHKYKKGFKFDHVWHIVKDMEKFAPTRSSPNVGGRKRSSEGSQTQTDRSEKSIGSSTFNVDLSDDFEADDPCNEVCNVGERPTGRKKEKMKKKLNNEHSQFLAAMQQETEHFKGMFAQNQEMLQKQYELQFFKAQNAAKKIALAEEKAVSQKKKKITKS